MGSKKKIFFFVKDKEIFKKCAEKIGVKGMFFNSSQELVQSVYSQTAEVPECIVVDMEFEKFKNNIGLKDLLKSIKNTQFLLGVPVLVICSKDGLNSLDFNELQVDDFLLYPLDELVCIKMLEVIRARSNRTLDANPLTKLPGNTSIINKVTELIEEEKDFAFGYVDLDNFKAFNDKYGFARGDDVIRLLARILVNVVNQVKGENFVGHIGGDDFVFIVPPIYAETVSRQIINFFDDIIPSFYDEEDLKRGKIIAEDRQGNIQEFPIMKVSIAIAINIEKRRFKHYGEMAKVLAELKEVAKKNKERSTYVIDRRNGVLDYLNSLKNKGGIEK